MSFCIICSLLNSCEMRHRIQASGWISIIITRWVLGLNLIRRREAATTLHKYLVFYFINISISFESYLYTNANANALIGPFSRAVLVSSYPF